MQETVTSPACGDCTRQGLTLTGGVCYQCYARRVMDEPWDTGMDEIDRRMTRVIVLSVCDVFGISWGELQSTAKPRHLAEARKWLIYMLTEDAAFERFTISRILQRHYSTVTHNLEMLAKVAVCDERNYRDTLRLLYNAFAAFNRSDPQRREDGSWYSDPTFGAPSAPPFARDYAFAATAPLGRLARA